MVKLKYYKDMANWNILKQAIANVIKINGNQEITGATLQNTLNSIVNTVGENATFAGIAKPETNPGTPDGPVFYIASSPGTYSNFNISIDSYGLFILANTNNIWNKYNVFGDYIITLLNKASSGNMSSTYVNNSSVVGETVKFDTNVKGGVFCTNLLSVDIGDKSNNFSIKLTNLYSNKKAAPSYCVVDKDYKVLSLVKNVSSATINKLDLPENAKYIIANSATNKSVVNSDSSIIDTGIPAVIAISIFNINNSIGEINNSIGEINNSIGEIKQQLSEKNLYADKNVVIFGDSITWYGKDDLTGDRGWTKWFNNHFEFKSIRSYARSGATWTATKDTIYDVEENTGIISANNCVYNQVNRMIDAINKGTQLIPDYIFVALGTNDFQRGLDKVNTEITIAESLGTDYSNEVNINTCTTFIKAMRYFHDQIWNIAPDAQVIILTPLQRGTYLEDMEKAANQIKKCAGYLAYPVIDQFKNSMLSSVSESLGHAKNSSSWDYTPDGLHPSARGAKFIGDWIAQQAKSIMRI